jgi:hypothetical protein
MSVRSSTTRTAQVYEDVILTVAVVVGARIGLPVGVGIVIDEGMGLFFALGERNISAAIE